MTSSVRIAESTEEMCTHAAPMHMAVDEERFTQPHPPLTAPAAVCSETRFWKKNGMKCNENPSALFANNVWADVYRSARMQVEGSLGEKKCLSQKEVLPPLKLLPPDPLLLTVWSTLFLQQRSAFFSSNSLLVTINSWREGGNFTTAFYYLILAQLHMRRRPASMDIKKFPFLHKKKKRYCCDIGTAIGQFAANVGWAPSEWWNPTLGFDDAEFK